ncbi:PREDICTED: uncharacterized protein LOC109131671 [Camelina sativa]|uniref:Uncharacterized protein LOC109131671 n=1 Tax=Camelina sativa TaxID=90675 RepID=A0ABM1RH96_CAMSA|nr:PREDICTED: uncharacterized protein LOC109131671 [Camelina sativa]
MMNLEKGAETKQILIRDHDVKTELEVYIFEAFAMDERDVSKPYYGPNYYFIKAWIDETKEYGTKVVKDSFVVNQRMVIPLDFPAPYLYIELLRGFSYRDPGTSNGTVVMGRAKIQLPPWNSHGRGVRTSIDLVGFNGNRCVVKKGYVKYLMTIRKKVVNHRLVL